MSLLLTHGRRNQSNYSRHPRHKGNEMSGRINIRLALQLCVLLPKP